jgi:hypothetical protein
MVDGMSRVFSRGLLKIIQNAPAVQCVKHVPHVFISVDPNGGGSSKYAIASCYYVGPTAVVRSRFHVLLHHAECNNARIRVTLPRDRENHCVEHEEKPIRLVSVLSLHVVIALIVSANVVLH